MSTVTLKIENDYSDGHHSEHEVTIPHPRETYPEIDTANEEQVEEWFNDVVSEHLGDGHGADNDLGYCYEATVIDTDDPDLNGASYEWCGS